MSAMKVSEYMLQLVKELLDTKKITESSANAYIKSLYMLNGKVPFKTLTFLKKTDDVDAKISEYADNTQKSIYSAVVSVLSLFKDKPTYKKVYSHYYDKMMGKSKQMKEDGAESSEKTEKQKENWVDWGEVQKRSSELREVVSKFGKVVSPEQFEKLLHYVVLSLYTDIQPRRNQDYMDMWVVSKKSVEALPKDKNYLIVDGKTPKQFVFNKFKTSKTYGQQVFDIPESLASILSLYLKHHPLVKGSKSKTTEYKFLVSADGTPLVAPNTITRILNKIFGKRIGSSMMRHIFLSSKYDIGEMEKDANAMGHSVSEQKKYMKKDDGDKAEVIELPMIG
jgi:hypothetical protein